MVLLKHILLTFKRFQVGWCEQLSVHNLARVFLLGVLKRVLYLVLHKNFYAHVIYALKAHKIFYAHA